MVVVREISNAERDYWDKEIQRFDYVHPFNAFAWGQVRAIDGWHPIYIVAERQGALSGVAMILEKKIPLTPFCIFYCPKGPVWNYEDEETLQGLVEKLKEIAKKKKAIFVRVDPNIPESLIKNANDKLSSNGFIHLDKRWSFWNAPCGTYRMDLRKGKNEDELFKMIDPKARTGVRKALSEGVTVRSANSKDDIIAFFKHFREFADQKGFMTRGYHYMECLWEEYLSQGKGSLFIATYQGEIIGGEVCLIFGQFCAEMHRAVPYEFHKLRVNELLVWEGIKTAKRSNCTCYSLRGAGPTPAHDQFKEKFATLVSLAGYYDYPFRQLSYKLFCFGEFVILPRAWPILVKARKLYLAIKNTLGRNQY